MEMGKTLRRNRDMLRRNVDVAVSFWQTGRTGRNSSRH